MPRVTRTATVVASALALALLLVTGVAGSATAGPVAPSLDGAALAADPSRSALVQATIAAATSMVGRYPYSWGGGDYTGATVGNCCSATGSDGSDVVGFDCSGLMEYVFFEGAGLRLSSTSRTQYADGPRVSIGRLEPGDLVFWSDSTRSAAAIHHVALYIGNNQIVESVRSTGPRVRTFSTRESDLMPSVVRPIG